LQSYNKAVKRQNKNIYFVAEANGRHVQLSIVLWFLPFFVERSRYKETVWMRIFLTVTSLIFGVFTNNVDGVGKYAKDLMAFTGA
jgi:hypothetical protein